MSETSNERGPWFDRPLYSAVLGGVIASAVFWLLTQIAGGIAASLVAENDPGKSAQVPVWVYLILLGAAALVASLAVRLWRRTIWVRLPRAILRAARRGVSWTRGLRIVSTKTRESIEQQGYDRSQTEVEDERAKVRSPGPALHVRQESGSAIGDHTHWLTNRGVPVSQIELTCDPDFFLLDGQAYFPGVLGTNNMARFTGGATERGANEGVWFHATWVDANGDSDETDFLFPPEEIQEGRSKALEDARVRGVFEGRTAMKKELEGRATQQVPLALPLPDPRWRVYPDEAGDDYDWILRNAVPRSVAKEVRLESKSGMEILDAGHWSDLSGGSKGATGSFRGEMDDDGATFGVHFTLVWYDENNSRRTGAVSWPGHQDRTTLRL